MVTTVAGRGTAGPGGPASWKQVQMYLSVKT